MAILWRLVAPLGVVEVQADGLYRAGGEGDEASIAASGWFLLLGLAVGIVVAALVYLRWRPLDLAMLLGLALGGLLGSVIAWRVGVLLGPGSIEATARGLKVGSRFDGPLDLPLKGALVAWPLASTIASFGLVAGASEDVPEPRPAPHSPDPAHNSPVSPVSPVSLASPVSPVEPPPPYDPR